MITKLVGTFYVRLFLHVVMLGLLSTSFVKDRGVAQNLVRGLVRIAVFKEFNDCYHIVCDTYIDGHYDHILCDTYLLQ